MKIDADVNANICPALVYKKVIAFLFRTNSAVSRKNRNRQMRITQYPTVDT